MDQVISLAHGAGGKQTSELIEQVFKHYFYNSDFTSDDAAVLNIGNGKIALTTDGFVVSPCEFPGGNIGKLSICGTVNDLACMGAKPKYITCAFIIEEGFKIEDLKRIVKSMAETAKEADVKIVAGDTKVVKKGQADGIYITTTGVGICRKNVVLSGSSAKENDLILVTGDIGRHGCTILLEREEFGISANLKSDCAPLSDVVESVLDISEKVHVIRDATRGGVGNVLYEIAKESNIGVRLNKSQIPISNEVQGICDMLGLDPLYMANEGTMIMIVSADDAKEILDTLHKNKYAKNAKIIGSVTKNTPGIVTIENEIGIEIILPRPSGEMLPRIC